MQLARLTIRLTKDDDPTITTNDHGGVIRAGDISLWVGDIETCDRWIDILNDLAELLGENDLPAATDGE